MAKGRISQQDLKRDPLMEQYVSASNWIKGRSQPVVKWATIVAIVIAVAAIGWLVYSRRESNAREALSEAFRYHDAVVSNPIPANVKGYAFTTEDEKDRKAFDAFQKAADDYPSYNGEVGRLYAAIHQLNFEPEKADVTLRDLSKKDSEVGAQATMLVAERLAAAGKLDEALAEYNRLKAKPYSIPTQLIDAGIADTYEAQGKAGQAVDLYFGIANDPVWRSTPLGINAANRLSILAPDKFDQLPEVQSASAFSSSGLPMNP